MIRGVKTVRLMMIFRFKKDPSGMGGVLSGKKPFQDKYASPYRL